MARLDFKRGRFSAGYETSEINKALHGFQSVYGDSVAYYRFLQESSQSSDIYDEGHGVGKVYRAPFALPVLHVIHQEGRNEDGESGFYFNDDLSITASFDQVQLAGLSHADIRHQAYLKDRLVYDGKVFRVADISITGQIQRRDIIVAIHATQVKPDELVNDAQFSQWAEQPG